VEASRTQPERATRRIIERPRLIKLLEESEARVILLLAPAGYGKTTLARQWAKTLSRPSWVWLSCLPAHRDVVTLAMDVADRIESSKGSASRDVREYVSGQSNPQRSSHRIGTILADHLKQSGVRWVVIDDYHEISEAPEAEEFIDVLLKDTPCRFIVASRNRPRWATARRIVYGEITELARELLAMTQAEAQQLLGKISGSAALVKRAEGWPAVLALAAGVKEVAPPDDVLPSALHGYLAQELFQRAPERLQDQLVRLALLPDLSPEAIESVLGVDGHELIRTAAGLGFVGLEDPPTFHPLLREFLLEKLAERSDSRATVHSAVGYLVANQQWSWALELVSRFSCDDLIEPVLQASFKPLARNGQIVTLASFARRVRLRPTFPPPSVDLVEAEVALRDGQLALAEGLAARAEIHLPSGHALRSRASAIRGHSHLQFARFHEAELAFGDARTTARDGDDEVEAIHGVALARIMGEQANAREVVDELLRRRHESPTLLVRAVTAEISRRRFTEGIASALPIHEAKHSLEQVEDPRIRTSFKYTVAYALGQRAEYTAAAEWLDDLATEIEAFDLEFAKPHVQWVTALVRLGLRRFGETERLLQAIEDSIAGGQLAYQQVNARSLRARLLLQSGKAADAAELTADTPDPRNYPSWRAEYIATRGLALACLGDEVAALEACMDADATSRVVEVRVLSEAARAVIHARKGSAQHVSELLDVARSLGAWDPVVCALRASQELSDALANDPSTRRELQSLYSTSNDLGLARRAGFRVRATRSPGELLTPREFEVLGLIARGMKTSEIAKALFISQSTAKVHARHVLEKLGVRTRAEAVARYEMFADTGYIAGGSPSISPEVDAVSSRKSAPRAKR
jgi:ATP/maltotriose-dependent transcriptional regulator MalT